MTEVIMPKMGDGMEEGTLLEWLKKEGENVKSGEPIATIQTDKAVVELEAPATGVLGGILLQAGGTVAVGSPIASVLKQGESLPPSKSTAETNTPGANLDNGATGSNPEGKLPKTDSPVEPSNGKGSPAEASAPSEPATEEMGRVKASPLAKKIARENSIDLSSVQGSGPGGRIVERDVRGAQPAPPVSATPALQATTSGADVFVALPKLRQITAKRTTESKQQVPHFYVTVEVDVESIVELREMFASQESGKVSINDFVVAACARALRDMPEVNAAFEGKTVRQFAGIHIGIAAAVAEGLTVPVIKNADHLSLRQISAASKALVQKAKENRLGLEEVTGSTFSISNMGMLDVDNFIAIINQPNAAILAIASVRKKAVVDDAGTVVVRSRMNVTCSFDHRVVDGAIGAKFANVVKDYLQNPTRLII